MKTFSNSAHILYALASLLVLSGCDTMEHNASRAGQSVRESYDNTRYRIANYIYSRDDATQSQPIPPLPPSSFCYQLLTDIVCYDRPHPNLHMQLIAVQGEHMYNYEDFLPNSAKQALVKDAPTHYAARADSIIAAPLIDTPAPATKTPFHASPSPAAGDDAAKVAHIHKTPNGAPLPVSDAPIALMK